MDSVHATSAEYLQIQGTLERLKLVQTCVSKLRQLLKCKDNKEVVQNLATRSDSEVLDAMKAACGEGKKSLNDPVFTGLGLMKLMQRLDITSQSLVQALFFVALDHMVFVLEREDFRRDPLEGITLAYYMICLLLKNHRDWLEEKLVKVQRDLVYVTLDIFDLCIQWRSKPSPEMEALQGQICVVQWSTCRCIQEIFQSAKRASPGALLQAVRTTLESPSAKQFYYFVSEEVCRGQTASCMAEVMDFFKQTAVLVEQKSIHPSCRQGLLFLLSVLHGKPGYAFMPKKFHTSCAVAKAASKRTVTNPLQEYKYFEKSSNSAFVKNGKLQSLLRSQSTPMSPSNRREQLRQILIARATSTATDMTSRSPRSEMSSNASHACVATALQPSIQRDQGLKTETVVATSLPAGACTGKSFPKTGTFDQGQGGTTLLAPESSTKQKCRAESRQSRLGTKSRKRPLDCMHSSQ